MLALAPVRHLSVVDVPLLGGEAPTNSSLWEIMTTPPLEVADGDREAAQGVAIQEVGRLVKHEKMGVIPHGAGDDDLDLLSSGQGADLVVIGNLGIQAQILKVLADHGRLQLTIAETLAGSLVVVEFLDKLVKAELEERLARDLGVVLGEEAAPFPKNPS